MLVLITFNTFWSGYEDPKKSSSDGIKLAEINRRNKSLYGLLNVISALKANELRLPYRESKITRILQDSLGCTSHILLLACLVRQSVRIKVLFSLSMSFYILQLMIITFVLFLTIFGSRTLSFAKTLSAHYV